MSTQVMKRVTSAEGPLLSKGRLPLRPGGSPAAPQARNASGAASEGSVTEAAGARLKETAQDVNVNSSRSGEALELPGGIKLNFHFQNGPSQRPWLYITGVGTAMGALGTYVGYKAGKAAGMLWGPVEAVGEKYAAGKEKVKSKTEAWKERFKQAPAQRDQGEPEGVNGVQAPSVTINGGKTQVEAKGGGQKAQARNVPRSGFATDTRGPESGDKESGSSWKAAARAAVAEKKKHFEKFLERKDGESQ
ncbi:hypothetical protein KFL_000110250 [Klebsormidium nitens]|uniref:Uncharacterized protein n=1 Tax=Klebsormidium nitens TaxID=105231 RepID=A0A1Y1HR81_KLENI|nr:hypothetical protein KFL_000110250 [Klebsormidium nitens]|eukprot:GAQ78328.1 hypothetical protein KFL_000110250 [Klebsormidium nitens]